MATIPNGGKDATKEDEETLKRVKRAALRELNRGASESSKQLDSSLKRHTALIKRMRQSIGADNHDQIARDINSLALGKYIDEIIQAAAEGAGRCKTDKDAWSAVEIISMLHRRFPESFTDPLIATFATALAPPSRAHLATLSQEQRDKDEAARVIRQRPLLKVCAELALVGIITDGPGKSGGEWIMKVVKDLLSNDPSLSSLPLLSMFLKSFSRPYLGLTPPSSAKKQVAASNEKEGGSLSAEAQPAALSEEQWPKPSQAEPQEEEELVEKDIRDKFKRMCEGYFDTISKKLVKEHIRLQEQDKRNHEAYIRSGEIFEDRQQAYEKMTKSYEKMLSSCQTLSELLYLPLPHLPNAADETASIGVLDGSSRNAGDDAGDEVSNTSKWEDEEERKFYEDILDLKDYVPRTLLGVEASASEVVKDKDKVTADGDAEGKAEDLEEKLDEETEKEVARLEAEMENLKVEANDEVDDTRPSPAVSPAALSDVPLPPMTTALLAGDSSATTGAAPSAMLTSLLARLSDCTNKSMIDQAAVDFAFLNSKAARKRLVRFLGQVPKNRTDLLPYYARLVATLNVYMPDVGSELISILEEEFRYLQRKKNVIREFTEHRLKNMSFLSALTKFKIVPPHLILHIFKVFLDDFSGVNIDNMALLLEGCGRYLMRTDETRSKMTSMLELMRRKQQGKHLDQRQILLLENAYYQCNPPERAPRQVKERSVMEQFIMHLAYDVLSKKTIDKVLKLLRKLDWDDPEVRRVLHRVFTKPWKLRYSSISLLAMLTYDLQRYHPDFVIGVVDQVIEDVRRGLETNLFKYNQRRVATIKYLGELYIFRLISSSLIFDTFWVLVTFGHPDGRPNPYQSTPIDAPDDFFRIRLVCILLDGCGMCFDRGSLKKKLDSFLTFFQYYVLCKEELPMDIGFMLTDTLEALRPKMVMAKTVEEAAEAVDAMFDAAALSNTGPGAEPDEDEDEDGRRGPEDEDALVDDDNGPIQALDPDGDAEEPVLLTNLENQGPTEEADAEFAKELAKMLSDTSTDARKVDKKTALALWDSAGGLAGNTGSGRKRRGTNDETNGGGEDVSETMRFTVITRRGNRQQTRELPVPATSSLAVQTRTAQMQDRVEQQQLKKIVLDYEKTAEIEETKALETAMRNRGFRVKYGS